MKRWFATMLCAILLSGFVFGCGQPKKDPTLQDKDRPKPAEKKE